MNNHTINQNRKKANIRFESDVTQAQQLYDSLGFDTLPLRGKVAYQRGWQRTPSRRLWRNAPDDANIGIRGGGVANVAVIDADDKKALGTSENVRRYLEGLGLKPGDYPMIRTASGVGRHAYLKFAGGLNGDYHNLSKDFGSGEFRHGQGAYVVAPPSEVEGNRYALIAGQWEQIPALGLAEVWPLIERTEHTTQTTPKLPRLAMALLHGNGIERYRSRSEAEHAILQSLANVGFDFSSVLSLFNRYPAAGKFAELRAKNPRNAERWLLHSFTEAQRAASTDSRTRRAIQAALKWTRESAWPGRTGMYDRAAYIAVLEMAHNAGRLEVAASSRDVGERAGISHMSASRALRRLSRRHKTLEVTEPATGESAARYRVLLDVQNVTLPKYFRCEGVEHFAHDLFRKGYGKAGLGKTAGEIWAVLQVAPATVAQLARCTGRHRITIERNLVRMAHIVDRATGEVFQMIRKTEDGTWEALPVDLDAIAVVVGTAGATQAQRARHERERREHTRALRAGRITGGRMT